MTVGGGTSDHESAIKWIASGGGRVMGIEICDQIFGIVTSVRYFCEGVVQPDYGLF